MGDTKPQVAVMMGSDSDWPVMKETALLLKKLKVPFEVHVLSAHRTPEEAGAFARGAEKAGIKIIIAAAGGAAHLAGVMASWTTLPVIGVPLEGWALSGLDALLSTVQMPGGIPVATVAIGKAGARNAAILAAQILGITDRELAARVTAMREESKAGVLARDRAITEEARHL
jgi:phosphoribosylaminoimidazole carboxylase PurE protein